MSTSLESNVEQRWRNFTKNIKGLRITTNGRIEWKYFYKLDNILAARPATYPPVLLETLKPVDSSDSDITDVEEKDNMENKLSCLQMTVNFVIWWIVFHCKQVCIMDSL